MLYLIFLVSIKLVVEPNLFNRLLQSQNNQMNNKQLRWFYLVLLSLIWGSSFILMKKAMISLTPIQVGALRMIITAIILISIGFKHISKITKEQWNYIFLTALLVPFSQYFFLHMPLKTLTVLLLLF
jgi:drug/metabolite transporter (DMT)-like permease